MRAFACDLYRDESEYQTSGVRGRHLSEPVAVAYASATGAGTNANAEGSWQLFPRGGEPLALGGRRVESAPLGATDVDM
jgi:hypothetical protein